MTFTNLAALTLGTILEGIFYGLYVVLFTLYLALRHRNKRGVDPLTLAQILLFGLCTVIVCIDISATYFFVVPHAGSGDITRKLFLSTAGIFITIDYLAQMILLYRCWIIWDKRWAVVAIPGFLAFVTLGGGFALLGVVASPLRSTERAPWLYQSIGTTTYSISLGVNALTTSLIVTKILLTSREVRHLGVSSHRSLRIVTAVLIESGLLMFAFQLVFVVLFSTGLPAVVVVSAPLAHVYGITPLILNIRVVMGSAYDKTTVETGSLVFAHPRGAATQISRPSVSAAGVQSRVIDTNLDEVSDSRRAADATV